MADKNGGQLGELLEIIKKQSGNYDMQLIEKAFNVCKAAHSGQKRLSGEPFYYHPFFVACIVARLGMDTESIVAALLHDVVEDTELTLDNVKREFGNSVSMIVDGVTKLGKVSVSTKEEQQAENIRKMLLAMAEDIRVIIIKLADRLHNMRTIDAQPEQKQREKSLETLEIYAPIAHRLGIRPVKEELEDLAIMHLDPIAYEEIKNALEKDKEYRDEFLKGIQNRLYEKLSSDFENVKIEGRVKSINGIYRKMYVQGKQFEEIYDIYALRIIVNTVNDCYNVLGIIHEMFRPIPGRFKDYISTPKANMYRSLHTTVISRNGAPFEVQIRTWEMHKTAEYGIAAHWKYKDGISGSDERFEERLAWIRQLLENQREADDVEEIVRTIKTDLSQEDVFGVTPKGDVINLPVGSTVIDFAYAIHSAVGNKMVGAKVDGRIVPIDHQIVTGEVIEILTSQSPNHGPSRDWLNIVKTSEARNKIRSWFKKERKAENIEQGKAEIEREFRRNSISLTDAQMEKFLAEIAERQKCANIEELYAKIGYGGILVSRIMPRIKEEYLKLVKDKEPAEIDSLVVDAKSKKYNSGDGVVVNGIDNCLIKLSRCCNPLPGDSIIGFITRGHGVSIHKRDCTNVPHDIAHCAEPERWVAANWGEKQPDNFKSSLQMLAFGRSGLLADITATISNMRVMIYSINARELKNGNYSIDLTVNTESVEHLRSIVAKLSKVEGVYSVERSLG